MSLVEKALRKMQDAAKAAPARSGDAAMESGAAASGRYRMPDLPQVTGNLAREWRDAEPMAAAKVVTMNLAQLRATGLLPPEHQERQIAQQYRQIKRPLIANAVGRGGEAIAGGQLIMVASAMPGEGKTFTSMNLALSLAAERDLNVLLVDADVAKPHVSKLLGLEQDTGLLDLLRDPELDPEGAVLPTNVPGLSVMPAGRHSADATELLSSARMEEITTWLAARDPRRVIVFDSPPLLLATESHAIAAHCGQVVCVVRAGITPQGQLNDALDFVRARPFVALVLNQSVSPTSTQYYHYYGDAPKPPAG